MSIDKSDSGKNTLIYLLGSEIKKMAFFSGEFDVIGLKEKGCYIKEETSNYEIWLKQSQMLGSLPSFCRQDFFYYEAYYAPASNDKCNANQ